MKILIIIPMKINRKLLMKILNQASIIPLMKLLIIIPMKINRVPDEDIESSSCHDK